MRKIKINNRLVGEGEPVFIVAEAGVNHNGNVDLAKQLIDAAKDAGADAVKFQVFKADKLIMRNTEKANYQKATADSKESQYELMKRLELTENNFKELADYANKKEIIFLASPYDQEGVDLLYEIDVPAFKVASGEITNFPLLKHIANKGKPIILSTGMSTLGEVDEALRVIRDHGVEDIVLLHCITSYPTKIEDVNLTAMQMMKCAFKLPVGFSDHTLGMIMPIAAVALGAVVIEKHFTMNRNLSGPDHNASLEPYELRDMVTAIRNVERALGDGIKRPTGNEEEIKKLARRSIIAGVDIPKGTVITEKMLDFKRPGTGISPKYINMIVGKRAKKIIESNELIDWNMI